MCVRKHAHQTTPRIVLMLEVATDYTPSERK